LIRRFSISLLHLRVVSIVPASISCASNIRATGGIRGNEFDKPVTVTVEDGEIQYASVDEVADVGIASIGTVRINEDQ
jgi:hypothetical protein